MKMNLFEAMRIFVGIVETGSLAKVAGRASFPASSCGHVGVAAIGIGIGCQAAASDNPENRFVP